MMLDEIATFITSNSTAFTVGGLTANMGKGQMDDFQTDTFTGLFHNPGSGAVHTFSTGTYTERVYEIPMLQVVNRSTSLQVALDNAYIIHGLLDGLGTTQISGVEYKSIRALQSPGYIGHDDNERYLVSTNYRVKKEST